LVKSRSIDFLITRLYAKNKTLLREFLVDRMVTSAYEEIDIPSKDMFEVLLELESVVNNKIPTLFHDEHHRRILEKNMKKIKKLVGEVQKMDVYSKLKDIISPLFNMMNIRSVMK